MDVFLIFILYCVTGISTRPQFNRIERDSKITKGNEMTKRVARQAPAWHISQDMFNLPRPFGLEDEIVVAVDMRKSERLSISFVTDENATEDSTVYKVVADLRSSEINFHHNKNTYLITNDKTFFSGNDNEFYATFKRKEDPSTQEQNILHLGVSRSMFTTEFTDIASMDNIRYIQITGDSDVKVKKIDFIFANHIIKHSKIIKDNQFKDKQ